MHDHNYRYSIDDDCITLDGGWYLYNDSSSGRVVDDATRSLEPNDLYSRLECPITREYYYRYYKWSLFFSFASVVLLLCYMRLYFSFPQPPIEIVFMTSLIIFRVTTRSFVTRIIVQIPVRCNTSTRVKPKRFVSKCKNTAWSYKHFVPNLYIKLLSSTPF